MGDNEKVYLRDTYLMFLNVLCLRPEEFKSFCINNYEKFKDIINYNGYYGTHYSTLMHVLITCTGDFIPGTDDRHLLWHKDYAINQHLSKIIFDFLLANNANPFVKDYYGETVKDLANNENFLSRRVDNEIFIEQIRDYFNFPKMNFY